MTPRQKECYDFLCGYIAENEISPSYSEIAVALGTESKSTVSRLLDRLEEQCLISRTPHRTRSIVIIPTNDIYSEIERLREIVEEINDGMNEGGPFNWDDLRRSKLGDMVRAALRDFDYGRR